MYLIFPNLSTQFVRARSDIKSSLTFPWFSVKLRNFLTHFNSPWLIHDFWSDWNFSDVSLTVHTLRTEQWIKPQGRRFVCPLSFIKGAHFTKLNKLKSRQGLVITYPVKCRKKLFIHSQTPTAVPLTLDNDYVAHSILYNECIYLFMPR